MGRQSLHTMSWVVSTTPTAISFSIYSYTSTSRFSSLRRLPNPNLSLNALPWHPRSRPLTFRTAALLQDAGAAAVVTAGAYGLGLTFDNLTQRKIIEQSLSRKLVHILSGLLFMVSWSIFSTSTEARYFASLVPVVNCLRELLRGPLYYVLILLVCTMVFWRESPIGVISLSMMCGGDGIADIMGRRFGSLKLPYNQQKSWAGSISMFVFGFLISIGMLHYFSALGYFQLDWFWTMEKVALISLVATVVESLPTTKVVDDNISVPLASMVMAFLSFGF
ncbi:phytol kinase 1, chloroplastic isoform X2 [Vitis vinifera]|uniref:phytol kinase 1, chloroplastic isoform X2 n=1 Tax=Vitis vinifera TaxID=29760 RepID=UPI00053F6AFA|nr:phytol kinase 1, chloroplastic isoform X2 [Vitis vinifera]|eukprot:XP_010658680.1 PREDICTED: phytol kinase 1, chloroplastic isoform X2 [Vitis vinifera]